MPLQGHNIAMPGAPGAGAQGESCRAKRRAPSLPIVGDRASRRGGGGPGERRDAGACRGVIRGVVGTSGNHNLHGATTPITMILQLLRLAGQVACHTLGVRPHPLGPLGPSGRTDLSMCLSELERIHHAQHLVHIASEWQVVDNLVLDDAVFVDQERAAQGHSARQYVVFASDILCKVGYQRIAYRTDAALVDRGTTPCAMSIMRIHGATDHLHVALLELAYAMIKGDDL